ncbi:hypothetical protein HN51_050721 [Arachis hypogaea]|uniref:uncharacterized protein n=1 Tax=Arachis hypogaea TaxID=3818 RepID=UPI000DECAE41|nr:uncharacterized protein LOC112762416 [Arachis hypogaea]
MDNNTTANGTNNFNVAESRDSSPRSRDADNNGNHYNNSNNSFIDEPPPPSSAATTAKVKFMCSYGGRIQPRPHDNQLTYIGGDTKIVAVDRHVKFSALVSKLCSIANADVCFKYQLPGEDLDALISVTNDEDLDHMMVEYDRLCRSSPRPARLRLILFPLPNTTTSTTSTTTTTIATTTNNAPLPPHPSVLTKPERQWFVDALNSVRIPEPSSSSSPTQLPHPSFAALNPDFLFGLDNHKPHHAVSMDPAPSAPTVPDFSIGSSENAPEAVGETEFVRHVQEMQRLHLRNNNTTSDQPPQPPRKSTEENGVEYYAQKNQEKPTNSGPVHGNGPVPVPVHGSFLHNPVGHGGGYSLPVSGTGVEPAPVYIIQTPSGVYQAITPVAGPVGPGPVYLIQKTPASVSHAPTPVSHAPAQNGGYGGSEVGSAAERGYSQVAYAVRPQAAAAPSGDGWN